MTWLLHKENKMKYTRVLTLLAALAMTTAASAASAAETPEARLASMENDAAIARLVTGTYPRALDERKWADYSSRLMES